MSRRSIVASLSVAALVAGVLGLTTAPPGAAVADAQSAASARLEADASGALTYRSSGGVYDFVGVPAGVTLDNPGVSSSTSVTAAAAAHLARYGAALGTSRPGTTITELRANPTVTGDVVRYQQEVDGVPVMGGELVVSLRADRELDSILAKTTRATSVGRARVSQAAATATAQQFFQGSAGKGAPATVVSVARWVVDPALIGASTVLPTRTAWRFELTRGAAERRMVLVDDQLGAVLMDVDLINEAKNRVVCDNNNVGHSTAAVDTPCVNSSPDLVRTEAGPSAALAEANTAFDLGGAVYDNYLAFGALDLVDLIGRVVDGGTTKALAQTVRWCYTGFTCPYANAFWNGSQMYYGQSYATADDVVGHEMTHGVTERNSGLFYWSQSGAMNESISDIMGEIIDHRNVSPPGEPVTWTMGEDLPIGAIRNVQNPPAFNDPDRTGSPLYVKENCCSYPDEDGVHTNSGVGNKTFYLASQGGTFNGQTMTGIDTGDPLLTKSAKLWLLTDQSLSSGSDYADEAEVLEQSCAALQTAAVMTAGDCADVHKATLATELRTTPVNNPQPTDATVSCPSGTPQVLFDSETGTPSSKFTAGAAWSRNGVPGWGQVAHSNPDAWSAWEQSASSTSSLTAAAPVALPAGQASYLIFQHWRLLQYSGAAGPFSDAGTVEINGADAAALPWVNGPTQTINGTGNPANGRLGFGGDSRGYVASRVDLSSFAGTNVTPRFSFNNNNSGQTFLGWWVDDVQVYTCVTGPPLTNSVLPSVTGTPKMGQTLTALPGTWSQAGTTFAYQWKRGGTDIPGAVASTYQPVAADVGAQLSVRVTASKAGFQDGVATSAATSAVQGVMTPGVVSISGTAQVGSTLTAAPGTWLPADAAFAYQWKAGGNPIAGATSSTYQAGAADVGKQLTVTVTGTKTSWDPGTATSAPTSAVAPATAQSVVAGAPTIKGKAVVGKTLTAVAGTWGPAPVTLTYQWLRNGAPIAGATGSTYKLKNKDKGKKISVRVTGAKSGFTSATATSPPTKKVKKKPAHHREAARLALLS